MLLLYLDYFSIHEQQQPAIYVTMRLAQCDWSAM